MMTPERLAEIRGLADNALYEYPFSEKGLAILELLAEVERLRAALALALMVGLAPHDISGRRMWDEARAALTDSPPPAPPR